MSNIKYVGWLGDYVALLVTAQSRLERLGNPQVWVVDYDIWCKEAWSPGKVDAVADQQEEDYGMCVAETPVLHRFGVSEFLGAGMKVARAVEDEWPFCHLPGALHFARSRTHVDRFGTPQVWMLDDRWHSESWTVEKVDIAVEAAIPNTPVRWRMRATEVVEAAARVAKWTRIEVGATQPDTPEASHCRDDFADVIASSGGIFDERGALTGAIDTLTEDVLKQGYAMEFRCQGCGNMVRITEEYAELEKIVAAGVVEDGETVGSWVRKGAAWRFTESCHCGWTLRVEIDVQEPARILERAAALGYWEMNPEEDR